MRNYFLIFLLIAGISTIGTAQKYAYCNGGNLLEALTAKESLDTKLEAFSAPLINTGQDMMVAIKTKEKKFYEDIDKGLLSQIAIQQRQQELTTEVDKVQEFEKEVVDKVNKKRQELLNPILERIQTAIDDVAKAGGYAIIFDESLVGGILYSAGAKDIGPEVRSKLGL